MNDFLVLGRQGGSNNKIIHRLSPSAGKKGRLGGGDPHLEPITREEMREADRRTIEEFGIPNIVLMENAALAVVREVADAASFVVV